MARGRKSSMPHYSAEQWAEIQPALRHLETNTITWAHQVLVERRGISEVASQDGTARQTVHRAVGRVLDIVSEHLEQGLRPVLVWVTQSQVPAVIKLAEQYGAPKACTAQYV